MSKAKTAVRWEIPGTPEAALEEKKIRERQRKARVRAQVLRKNTPAILELYRDTKKKYGLQKQIAAQLHLTPAIVAHIVRKGEAE